jgi:hypothetical protein
MNDSQRPFLSLPSASSPAAAVEDESGSKTPLLLVVLAALLVAVAGWFFLLRGDGADALAAPSPATPAAAAAEPTTDTVGVGGAEQDAAAQQKAEKKAKQAQAKKAAESDADARDPFKALVFADPDDADAAGVDETTGGSTAPVTVAGAPAVAPVTADPDAGAAVDDETGSDGGLELSMSFVEDDDSAATVDLAGERFVVRPQETFAETLELKTLSDGSCGEFTFGTQTFELCEGQSIKLG